MCESTEENKQVSSNTTKSENAFSFNTTERRQGFLLICKLHPFSLVVDAWRRFAFQVGSVVVKELLPTWSVCRARRPTKEKDFMFTQHFAPM